MTHGNYTGIDNLEVILDAVNYNAYLRKMVVENGRGAKVVL